MTRRDTENGRAACLRLRDLYRRTRGHGLDWNRRWRDDEAYVYGTRFDSTLKKGAPYAYLGQGDSKVVDGEILEIEPEKRLVMTWQAHWDETVAQDRPSRVTYELSAAGPSATKLHVVHDDFEVPHCHLYGFGGGLAIDDVVAEEPVGDGNTASDELIAVEGVSGGKLIGARRRLCSMPPSQ